MDQNKSPKDQIEQLTEALTLRPDDAALWLRRGKVYYQAEDFHHALNDFLQVRRLTGGSSGEADEYIMLLETIYAFRNHDLYNP